MQTYSIRKKLFTYLATGVGVLLLFYDITIFSIIHLKLSERFDQTLLAKAQMLISMTVVEEGEVELEFADEFAPEFNQHEGPHFFQLLHPDGTLFERSHSLGSQELPQNYKKKAVPHFQDITLVPGGLCRMVEISFIPANETEDIEGKYSGNPDRAFNLCLAVNRESFDSFLRNAFLALSASLLLFFVFLFWILKTVLNRGLEPLRDVRNQVAKMNYLNLDQPIVLRREISELTPIVNQLNIMLDQIKKAMERERNFTSNVSHELRTPISELRNIAEVALRAPDSEKPIPGYLNDIYDISIEMEQVVYTLLSLSRCDNRTQLPVKKMVNVSRQLEKAIQRKDHCSKNITFKVQSKLQEDIWISSDETMLDRIFRNLINNAITHSPDNSSIHIDLSSQGNAHRISFRNPSKDLCTDDLELIFDRFWQKDAARTGGQNTGLGLSLVQSFAAILQIEIETQITPDHTFVIDLILSENRPK